MQSILPLGEVRPSTTAGAPPEPPSLFSVPLLRLRGQERPVIQPADCRVQRCPVCEWRRAGLLSAPVAKTTVVRDSAGAYCVSDHCPGCGAWLDCRCPDPAHLDAFAEASYALGYDHGAADGPADRPSRGWLVEAGLEVVAYYEGYDAACAGEPPPAAPPLPYMLPEDAPASDGLPL